MLPDSLLAGRVLIAVACMTPRSRGRLSLAGSDPEQAPLIDHGYLSDPAGADLAVIADGIGSARALARSGPLAALVGEEIGALAGLEGEALADGIRRTHVHYYHPVGTARMGADGDELAVCEPTGRVRGSDRLWVADCSLIPTIPRANTNIPAVVVGERVAQAIVTAEGLQTQSMPGGLEGNVALLAVEILVAVPLLLLVVNRRRILGVIREMPKGRKRRS